MPKRTREETPEEYLKLQSPVKKQKINIYKYIPLFMRYF